MTITLDLKPEVQAELSRRAASQGRAFEAYAVSLLEEAARLPAEGQVPRRKRPPGRKSLVELFAESPLIGLDLDFSRNRSAGRTVDLS